MKRFSYILMLAVAFIFATGFQVKAQTAPTQPTTSTTGNDVWYYVECSPRSEDSNAKWLTGSPAGQIITNTVLAANADQLLWKVVANASGLSFVNKKFGTYLNADQVAFVNTTVDTIANARLTSVTAAPVRALKLEPYIDQTASGKPGGFYMVNSDAITPIKNEANPSLTFNFYSAGSKINSPINYGANAPNDNSFVKFVTAKEILLGSITKATAGYNNTSEGYNPGQFSPDDRDALFGVIEAVQEVYDNPASTDADYIASSFDLEDIFTQFKLLTILPELSSDNSEIWYYIQGTRPANTYMTAPAAGAGTQVKDLPVIPDATQLWKLVLNGDGFALQNKASQEYLITDVPSGTDLNTQSTMPTKALRFLPSNETLNKAVRFWIENTTSFPEAFRLHAGGSGNGWGVMNWIDNKNDNCSWVFLSEDELFRTELINAITDGQKLYNSSVEGVEFGQFLAASRTAFNAVLTTEAAKNKATMTKEELKVSSQIIKDAIADFTSNPVSTLASVETKKWFRLVNNTTAPYATGKAMSSNGRIVNEKFTFEARDVNSDAQLFSFELNGDGTKAVSMVNKANGLFMGTDGMMVETAPETEFEIIALDAVSFNIKPTGVSPLHAADPSEILNYDGDASSASAWRFEYVSSEAITEFKDAYLAKRIQMRAKVDMAKEVSGAEIGQYTTSSFSGLENLVIAEEAKDADALTQNEMKDAILAMNSASATLVINNDIKLLVSTNPNNYKWFRLINNMKTGNLYASGKAMSSNGRMEDEPFTWEDKDEMSDAQLFRFQLTDDKTQVAHILNKGSEMYVTADGLLAAASTVGNNFDITQLANGRSFWIDPTYVDTEEDPTNTESLAPLHAAREGNIVNWNSGAGSASAWIFEFVSEVTSVKNTFPAINKVRTINNIITIDGIDNFDVYSTTGQKLNHKSRLMTGVYIVRYNDYVQKVILK